MTSKEALRKLILDDFTPINDLVHRKGNNVQIAEPMYLGASPEDCYNIIEKDLDKLDQLEDIEDKLGCSIELYYKMCIEGTELYSLPYPNVTQWRHQYIYYKDFEGNAVFCLMLNSSLTPLYYAKDYGKTWTLTKGELENE